MNINLKNGRAIYGFNASPTSKQWRKMDFNLIGPATLEAALDEQEQIEANLIAQRQAEQNQSSAHQKNAGSLSSVENSSPNRSDTNEASGVALSVQYPNSSQLLPELRKYANFANKAKNLNKIYKKLDNQEHEIHNHTQEIKQLKEKPKNPGFWDRFDFFGNNEAKIAAEEEQISKLKLRNQLFSNVASILECANNQYELEEALSIYFEFIDGKPQATDPNQIKLSNLRSCQNEVIQKAITKNHEIRKRAVELCKVLTETVVKLVKSEHRLGGGADGTAYKATIRCLDAAQDVIRKCINKDKGRLVADPYCEIIPYQILQAHALKHIYSTIRDAHEFAFMHNIPVCFSAPPMPEPVSIQNVQTMNMVSFDGDASYLLKGKDFSQDIFTRLVPGQPLGTFIRNDGHGIVAKFSIKERLEICRQLLEAIEFVNDAGLIHHDLHPGNVMLDDSGAAHVIDLGRAIYLKDLNLLSNNASIDTLFVAPPESLGNEGLSLEDKTYRDTFDVYSLGLMFFSIIYGGLGDWELQPFLYKKGVEPYHTEDENGQTIRKDADGETINENGYLLNPDNQLILGTDPQSRIDLFNSIDEIVDRCTANCFKEYNALQQLSGDIKTLLQGMLNPDPEERPNAKQAKEFVSSILEGKDEIFSMAEKEKENCNTFLDFDDDYHADFIQLAQNSLPEFTVTPWTQEQIDKYLSDLHYKYQDHAQDRQNFTELWGEKPVEEYQIIEEQPQNPKKPKTLTPMGIMRNLSKVLPNKNPKSRDPTELFLGFSKDARYQLLESFRHLFIDKDQDAETVLGFINEFLEARRPSLEVFSQFPLEAQEETLAWMRDFFS